MTTHETNDSLDLGSPSDADPSIRAARKELQKVRSAVVSNVLTDGKPAFAYLETARADNVLQLELLIALWASVRLVLDDAENALVERYVGDWISKVARALDTGLRIAANSLPTTQVFENEVRGAREDLRNTLEQVHATYRLPVKALLRSTDAQLTARSLGPIAQLNENLRQQIADFQSEAVEARRLVQLLRGGVAAKAANEASEAYETRAREHADRESFFAFGFASGLVAVVTAVGHVLLSPVSTVSTPAQLGVLAFRGLLGIVATTAFARVMLKRWNLERNLRIIYDHRVVALKQYTYFEGLIRDDPKAQERLRLKVAEIIFSDPATGYKEDSGRELSVSPIFNVLEGVAGRASSAAGGT